MKKREPSVNKIDDAVLAVLSLGFFSNGYGLSAWKTISWEAMDRLFQKGFISDPKGKSKSVVVTERGVERAQALAREMFGMGRTKPLKGKSQERALQLKITIVNSEPPIWRRLVVPGSTNLGKFHNIMMSIFKWDDSHPHEFSKKETKRSAILRPNYGTIQ